MSPPLGTAIAALDGQNQQRRDMKERVVCGGRRRPCDAKAMPLRVAMIARHASRSTRKDLMGFSEPAGLGAGGLLLVAAGG